MWSGEVSLRSVSTNGHKELGLVLDKLSSVTEALKVFFLDLEQSAGTAAPCPRWGGMKGQTVNHESHRTEKASWNCCEAHILNKSDQTADTSQGGEEGITSCHSSINQRLCWTFSRDDGEDQCEQEKNGRHYVKVTDGWNTSLAGLPFSHFTGVQRVSSCVLWMTKYLSLIGRCLLNSDVICLTDRHHLGNRH